MFTGASKALITAMALQVKSLAVARQYLKDQGMLGEGPDGWTMIAGDAVMDLQIFLTES